MLFVTLAASARAEGDGAGRYLERDEYLGSAFPGGVPAARTLWIGGELRESMEDVLGHAYGALRVRYWYDGSTSVWVLDEIGKEMPITIGVRISRDAIDNVRILEFRESRGWEVRYPFFTDQFDGVTLDAARKLDRKIDGITGATLSVRAVERIARVALILHEQVSNSS